MNRRSLVFGGAAVAGLMPAPAVARRVNRWTDADVREHVGRIRSGMARAEAAVRKGIERQGADDPDLADAYLEAAPVVYAYGALHDLPLEAQVHPEGQALVREVTRKLGTSVEGIRDAMDDLPEDRIDAIEASLVGASERVAAGTSVVADDVDSGPVHVRLQAAQDQLRWRIKRKGLRRSAKELVANYDRLQDLVDRYGVGALPKPSRKVQAQVAQAQAHWESQGHPPAPDTAWDGDDIAGAVAGGLLLVAGLILIGFGGVTIVCPCVGIPLILAGALVFWAGVKMISAAGADKLRLDKSGWRRMPVELHPTHALRVRARSRIKLRGKRNRADGTEDVAGASAPAPGLPLGALVARVDDGTPFLVGRGPRQILGPGKLHVAINVEADQWFERHFTLIYRFVRP